MKHFFLLAATAAVAFSQSLIDQTAPIDILASPYDLAAVRVDARGDVYVAGTADLPLDSATAKIGTSFGNKDIWILKMDPTLHRIIYKIVIGGSGSDYLYNIKADASGNVFVLGSASADFPLQRRLAPGTEGGLFLLKLAPDGRLSYSILLGDTFGGRALDIDSSGSAYVGGGAPGTSLPLTPGVYLPPPREGPSIRPFVMKINPTGTVVDFATYLDGIGSTGALRLLPNGKIAFLTQAQPASIGQLNADASRLEFSATVGDGTGTLTTDGAGNFQVGPGLSFSQRTIVERFSPTGAKLAARVFEGTLSQPSMQTSLDGKTYLEGMVNAPDFPTSNTLEHCFANTRPPNGAAGTHAYSGNNNALVVFDSDDRLVLSTYLSIWVQAATLSADGRYLYAAGALRQFAGDATDYEKAVVRVDLTRTPSSRHVAPACLAHGANYSTSPTTPGGIMTIYGSNLGPVDGISFTLRNGIVPSDLAGTRVTVDGVPAPVLYAQDTQINFVVPWSTRTSGTVPVCVIRNGETACMDATADQVSPAPFGLGQTSVLNLDWSFNSLDHPVRRGGYITVYFTGTGKLSGTLMDGAVSSAILQRTISTATATIEGDYDPPCARFFGGPCPPKPQLPVEIVYAGSAPGFVSGVTQVNLRIPESIPAGSRSMRVTFAPADPNSSTGMLVHIAP